MPHLPRGLSTSLRWPVGILATGWTYLWRTTPLHRREQPGSWEQDRPRPLPSELDDTAVQHVGEGDGPLLHRCYRARIRDGRLDAATLIARLAADPNRVAPGTMAHFE